MASRIDKSRDFQKQIIKLKIKFDQHKHNEIGKLFIK